MGLRFKDSGLELCNDAVPTPHNYEGHIICMISKAGFRIHANLGLSNPLSAYLYLNP